MHIMHLVTRLLRAGSEENTIETCRYQAQLGHRVTLVHGQTFDPYWYKNPIEGVDLVALPEMVHPLQPFQDLIAYRKLCKLFATQNPDVIHTHQSKAGILGRLAAKVVPDAVVAHGIHIIPFEGMNRLKQIAYIGAERIAARKTDQFFAVSNAVADSYVRTGIASKDQVYCVRSGMDLKRFRNASWPTDWRSLLGTSKKPKHPRVALMMAAFEPRKRHLSFLRGFARVADQIPDLKLLLAGQGPEEHAVMKLVGELGLSHRVVFCGHRADPQALLAMADVLVLASNREGLPRVVIQALAAGVPAVVNDLPGLDEVLRHNLNGIITPSNNVEETANQMVRLLQDKTRLRRLQSGAAASDLQDWELAALGQRTTALYGKKQIGEVDLQVAAG